MGAGVRVCPHRPSPSRIRLGVSSAQRQDNRPASFGRARTLTAFPSPLQHHTMSRLAYYPTPTTRRLGNFTLDACPPASPYCLTHS